MAKRFIAIQGIILVAAVLFMLAGCENDYPPSLYDPNSKGTNTAVIAAVDPASVALSGVTVITITGANFSTIKEDNLVYFNAVKGTVLDASATQLTVRAPIYAADSIAIRIAVKGAALFSNSWRYKLEPAQEIAFKLGATDVPYAICVDAEGSLYASMVISNTAVGVKKFVGGKLTDFAPRGGETFYSSLKIGPDNVLYGVRNVKGIFTYKSGDAKPGVFASTGLGNIVDIDFDANKNLWGVGNNPEIYRIKPDKSIVKFAFKANLRAVRIYNNYLYAAGILDNITRIWRFPFSGEDLGAAEEVLNFTEKVGGGSTIYCITFSADGYMYIGTDAAAAVYILSPSGSLEPLYPGQFVPKTYSFAWGKGADLFMTREAFGADVQTIIRINTQKEGAPTYGIL